MTIVEQVAASERDVLWRYFQFYVYDMSVFTGARPVDGAFGYDHFDAYWHRDAGRSAYWAKQDDDIAGFALLRFDRSDNHHEMAEFFIVNRWRRCGIGQSFARQLFARAPGNWKLHQLGNNTGAIAFWRRVLDGFVAYTEAPLVYPDGRPRIEQRFVVC